ncbi:MAG: flagellar hook-associated protein FlgK [Pseudomonadota bacterium]
MSLTLALQSAKSGLITSQNQTAMASDNIANALTPGYVAREGSNSSVTVNGFGAGVASTISRRPVDEFLLRDIRFEASTLAGVAYEAEGLSVVTQVTGQPDEGRSVAAALAALEEAFLQLTTTPESASVQQGVLDAANVAVGRIQDQQAAIQSAREQADQTIFAGVNEVNDALGRLEELNERVVSEAAAGRDVSALLDERDRQLDRISEQIGIRSYTRENGELVVTTREGATLLDGAAARLEFTPSSAAPPGSALGAPLSGLTVNGADITPTGGGAQGAGSGKIAGAFAVRDEIMPQLQLQADELARGLIETFEGQDASLPPGAAGLFTDAGAAYSGVVTGLAGRIGVNAAVDPSAGGALWRLRDGVGAVVQGPPGETAQVSAFIDGFSAAQAFDPAAGLAGTDSLRGFASSIVADQQSRRVGAEDKAESASFRFDALETRRLSDNGVNIDEETAFLLQLEQAYAANAQVVQTVNRMLDDLLARIG